MICWSGWRVWRARLQGGGPPTRTTGDSSGSGQRASTAGAPPPCACGQLSGAAAARCRRRAPPPLRASVAASASVTGGRDGGARGRCIHIATAATPAAPAAPGGGPSGSPALTAGESRAPSVQAAPPPAEAWRRAKSDFERRRPRLGSLLANAHVLEIDSSTLVLGFDDRTDVDSTERARAEIEQALSAEMGRPVRLVTRQKKGTNAAAPDPRRNAGRSGRALDRQAQPGARGASASHHSEGAGPVRRGHPGDQDLMDGESERAARPDSDGPADSVRGGAHQDGLSSKTAEGESGGGLVRCTVSGSGEVLELSIDRQPVGAFATIQEPENRRMLEELVVGAVNVALARARDLAKQEMARGDGWAAHAPRDVRRLTWPSRGPSPGWFSSWPSCRAWGKRPPPASPFHILRAPAEDAAALAPPSSRSNRRSACAAICCDVTDRDPCTICADARRDAGLVCVVAQPQDVLAVERGGQVSRPLPRPARPARPPRRDRPRRPTHHRAAPALRGRDHRGHPGHQPQRRGGGHRRLHRQAGAPAGGSGDHAHRHRGAHGGRAGICRSGHLGARHRRAAERSDIDVPNGGD